MGCESGKPAFYGPHTRKAKAAVRPIRESGVGKAPHPYRCPSCGLWHVASDTRDRPSIKFRRRDR